MIRFDVEYTEYGKTVFKGKLTMQELENFMKIIDDKRMQLIENGESTLRVRRAKEQQEK